MIKDKQRPSTGVQISIMRMSLWESVQTLRTRIGIKTTVKVHQTQQQLQQQRKQTHNTELGSPRQALTKPYQTHPARPISQRPCVLAAKLNGVPSTLTSRSLAEMLTSSKFMGVRSARQRANSASTSRLLRKPRVPMKPRHTATTR